MQKSSSFVSLFIRLVGVLVFVALQLFAQAQYQALSLPDSLTKHANLLVREEEQNIRILSTSEALITYRQVITVLKEGEAPGVFMIYDKETPISHIEAVIYNKSGEVVEKLNGKDFIDDAMVDGFSVFQDNRVKYFAGRVPPTPYTIAWSYEQKLKGTAFAVLPDWTIQPHYTGVEKASLTVSVPSGMAIYYRAVNTQLEPTVNNEGGTKKYSWKVNNLTPIKLEPYTQAARTQTPKIQLAHHQFKIENYEGSMKDWKAFGLFNESLYAGRDKLPVGWDADIRKELDACKSNAEKVKCLYNWMQKNMRYVSVQLGIGGWQPFSADYVFQNKYGDCKALTNFMKSVLGVEGIRSYPVLIENREQATKIDTTFVHDPTFNHVVLYLPDEKIWLECTSTRYAVNYLGSNNCNRWALALTPEGGKWIQTPDMTIEQNEEMWQTQINVTVPSIPHIRGNAVARGSKHEEMKYILHELAPDEQQKWFVSTSKLPIQTVDTLLFTSEKIDFHTETSPQKAKLTFSASMSRLGSKSGKRWFIPMLPLGALAQVPPATEDRKSPVFVPTGYTQVIQNEFILPEGTKLESLPFQHKEWDTPFGSYKASTKWEGNKLTMERKLIMKAFELPADQYKAYTDFCKEVAKWDATKMVVVLPEMNTQD